MRRNLRAGLIGLGMMGKNHARVLSNLPGVDFIAIVDKVNGSNEYAYGRPVLNEIEDLISLDIDYVVVAVPTIFHLEVGLKLAASGIHALMEKPLAYDALSSLELAKAFKDVNIVGAVGHIERYNPAMREARRRLHEIGDIYQVVTRRQGPFPERISDVGVVKDLATHDIDLTSWITDKPYQSVFAQAASVYGRRFEDLVNVVGILQDGIITNHLVNWISPFKERTTMINGENGTFVIDTLTADLTFYKNGGKQSKWHELAQFRGSSEGEIIRFSIEKSEPLRLEHEAFRDAILGNDTEIVTFDSGLRNVMVAESILESSKTKSCITIHD